MSKTNKEILKEIEERVSSWSSRRCKFRDIGGKPSGDQSRHTCSECGTKRFEKMMILTGETKSNNFKTWLKWRCLECPIRSKWTIRGY